MFLIKDFEALRIEKILVDLYTEKQNKEDILISLIKLNWNSDTKQIIKCEFKFVGEDYKNILNSDSAESLKTAFITDVVKILNKYDVEEGAIQYRELINESIIITKQLFKDIGIELSLHSSPEGYNHLELERNESLKW